MSSPRITRSKAKALIATEQPVTKNPATKKPVTKNPVTKNPATEKLTPDVDKCFMKSMKSVPKNPDRLTDWLCANVAEFCATSREIQRAILQRFQTFGWTMSTKLSTKFIAVLEKVNELDAETSLITKDELSRLILCLVKQVRHRTNYDQIERVHALGYLDLSALSPYYVSDAFSVGTSDSVKSAIWAFKNGATMVEHPRNAALHNIMLVDLDAANIADVFLTSQGIAHTFILGPSGPPVKTWKEYLPFIAWAKDHSVELPENMWSWHNSPAWLKWLDGEGLMPAKDARTLSWFNRYGQNKDKLKLLQSKYGFIVEEKPDFSRRVLPDVAVRKYQADPAPTLSGPMPENSLKLADWIRVNLEIILGDPELQAALSAKLFGCNLAISNEVLDALTSRGTPLLKTGLLTYLEPGVQLRNIPTDVFQRLYAEGVFTLDDLSPNTVNRGFMDGRPEAVKTAIWLFKTGKPLRVPTVFGRIHANVCDVDGANLMREFFAEQKISHWFTMDLSVFGIPSAEKIEQVKLAVDWFMDHSYYSDRQSVLLGLVRKHWYGAQWLTWLAEKNYLPKSRVVHWLHKIPSRSPAYWAELVRLGFTETPKTPFAGVDVHYTPTPSS